MTVRSIARNAVEMSPGDTWLDVIRADSILAITTTDGGNVELYTNIIKLTNVHGAVNSKNAAALATDRALWWTSGAMNANEQRESAISLGDAYGIECVGPVGSRVVIYIN